MALGLEFPRYVVRTEFDAEGRGPDLRLDFGKGGRSTCPECGKGDYPAHHTTEPTWRYLDSFRHEVFLHSRVPRVAWEGCSVKRVEVPWTRNQTSHEDVRRVGVDEASVRRSHKYLTLIVDLDAARVLFGAGGPIGHLPRLPEVLEALGGACVDAWTSPAYRKGFRDTSSLSQIQQKVLDRLRVQPTRARARSFRSTRNPVATIYLVHGESPNPQPI